MITETQKAKMQAELDQNWADIEAIFDKSGNLWDEAIEFFGPDSKPYTPESCAVLCISLARMQVAFNALTRKDV